jgi:hypothetical protein
LFLVSRERGTSRSIATVHRIQQIVVTVIVFAALYYIK